MYAQRQYVAHVSGATHRVGQYAFVLHGKTAQPGVKLIITISDIGYYLLIDISIRFDFGNN